MAAISLAGCGQPIAGETRPTVVVPITALEYPATDLGDAEAVAAAIVIGSVLTAHPRLAATIDADPGLLDEMGQVACNHFGSVDVSDEAELETVVLRTLGDFPERAERHLAAGTASWEETAALVVVLGGVYCPQLLPE